MRHAKLWASLILLLFAIILGACQGQVSPEISQAPETPPPEATPVTLKFIWGDNGLIFESDRELINQFTAQTGIEVDLIIGPESVTERLELYKQQLAEEQSSDIDVYYIDVIWPGVLAEHMLDLNDDLADEASKHFPAIIENNTVQGKLVGMPFYTDAGLLYYRTDLLAKYDYDGPPQTWAELEEMALTIQQAEREAGNPDFWGFIWQGAPYEGLTTNALEWQVSHGGGRIIEPNGAITVNNPQAILAFERAAGWIGTISPPAVTGYREEDARSIWQLGNAAFMRNWPYAYALGQADDSLIKDAFAATVLPSGGVRHANTLGGWQLAVSRYSEHPKEAVRLVEYLTGGEAQRRRAIDRYLLPTIAALYDDQQVLEANPFYADLKDVFLGGAVARPSTVSGSLYNEVSVAYFTAVHNILTGKTPPSTAVVELETELVELTGFETGLVSSR